MKKKIAIVGAGPCGLMLACELNPEKFEVSLYERNAAPGRKFLVAGDGGLNLTHSEEESKFILRYTPNAFLQKAFTHFSNKHLVNWFKALGIETYVGSSGRIFPLRGIKPVEVLNAILAKTKQNNVNILTKHELKEFSGHGITFSNTGKEELVKSDLTIFCLGGASWPVTGSTGTWTEFFKAKGVKVNPFQASNCAFKINWPEVLIPALEGQALKNITITCEDQTHAGEVVLTRFGVEGSGVYPLSPQIRSQLTKQSKAKLYIDFKPALSHEHLFAKLKSRAPDISLTAHLKKELRLTAVQIALLKHFLPKEEFLNETVLAKRIKHFVLIVSGPGPIEDAISTVGGIDLQEITDTFELKKMKDHFVIGEMIDYDAPTGGYLLQSCFSMANYLADHLNAG